MNINLNLDSGRWKKLGIFSY